MESKSNPYAPPKRSDEQPARGQPGPISWLIVTTLSFLVITPAATGLAMMILVPIAGVLGTFFDDQFRESIQKLAVAVSVLAGLVMGIRTTWQMTVSDVSESRHQRHPF